MAYGELRRHGIRRIPEARVDSGSKKQSTHDLLVNLIDGRWRNHFQVRDVIFSGKAVMRRGPGVLGLSEGEARRHYGAVVYAKAKRQLSKREIRRLRLRETALAGQM